MTGAGDLAGTSSITFAPTGAAGTPGVMEGASTVTFTGEANISRWRMVGRMFLHTAANWRTDGFFFEVEFRADAGTVRADLWDLTAGEVVQGSAITTNSGTFTRQRSAKLSLRDGREYQTRFGADAADAGEYRAATLISY